MLEEVKNIAIYISKILMGTLLDAVANWKRKLGQIYPNLPKLGQSWTKLPMLLSS